METKQNIKCKIVEARLFPLDEGKQFKVTNVTETNFSVRQY